MRAGTDLKGDGRQRGYHNICNRKEEPGQSGRRKTPVEVGRDPGEGNGRTKWRMKNYITYAQRCHDETHDCVCYPKS